MKTLTTNQENARAAGGHSVSRFIKLGDVFYSERSTSVFNPDSSKTFVPLLMGGTTQIRERSANMGLEELPKVQRLDFTIHVSSKYETPIDIQVDDAAGAFVGREVIFYKVFRNLPGVADPTETDWIEMFRGEVETVNEIALQHVSFTAVDFAKRAGENRANRAITRTLFPNCPEQNLGDIMPIIFGPVTGAPGIQVDEGVSSTLDESITAAELSINLADASSFSTSGKAQVGSEKFEYASKSGDNLVVSSVANRGVDGTTAAEHSFGQKVTQLGSRKFLIADQDLTHNDTVSPVFGLAGSVTDANGAVFDGSKYTTSVEDTPDSENQSTFITVDDDGFPDLSETLTNTVTEDLDGKETTPIELGTGSGNDATNPTNAAASQNEAASTFASDAHTTAATVIAGQTLHVKQLDTNDLSASTGDIKKVIATCEYAVVPFQQEAFPTGSAAPIFHILRGDGVTGPNQLKSANLAEPGATDVSTDLFPEDDRDGDSTDLFETTGASLGFQQTVDTRFKEFSQPTITQTWDTQIPTGTIDNDSFLLLQGFNDGDSINYSATNVRSTLVTGLVGAFTAVGDNWVRIARLSLRLFDDGSWPTDTAEISANVSAIGFDVSSQEPGGGFPQIKGLGIFRIYVGTQNFPANDDDGWVEINNLDAVTLKTAQLRLKASEVFGDATQFSQADLASVEIQCDGWHQIRGGSAPWRIQDAASRILYRITGVSAAVIDGTGLVGQDTSLDSASLITSQRVTQEIDISDELSALDPPLLDWDYFDGTGVSPPGFAIEFPLGSSGYQVLVYKFGFRVEILETTTRATNPDEFTLRADCIGIKNGTLSTLTTSWLINTILGSGGGKTFYALNGARIDATSLTAALQTNATAELASGDIDDWVLSRRLVQPLTNRELLGQALTDCAVRSVIEERKFKFFPSISAEHDDVATRGGVAIDIDGDKTVSPTRQSTNIALVSNDLTLQYDESIVSPGKFQDEINVVDTTSVNDISARVTTRQSHFIKVDEVATAWANLALDDFAFARSLVNVSFYGPRNADLEVGDAISLTDSFTRFFGQVGRIIAISRNDDAERTVRHQLALTNKRLIIWQHGVEGDSDFSKIEVNTFTQTVFFTVDNIFVAKLFGGTLQIKGGSTTDLITSSIENTVNDAEIPLDRANGTGTIEYLAAPAGFSNGFIAMGVHNGPDDKYYRVVNLGYNTQTGGNFHDSLFVSGDYEDNPAMPVDLSVATPPFEFDNFIVTTNTATDEDGNLVMTGDKRRMYLALNKFDNAGAINGRLVLNEIQTDVNLQ